MNLLLAVVGGTKRAFAHNSLTAFGVFRVGKKLFKLIIPFGAPRAKVTST